MAQRKQLSMEHLPRVLQQAHGKTTHGQWEQGNTFAGEDSSTIKTQSTLATFVNPNDAQFVVLAHEATPRFAQVIEQVKRLHPTIHENHDFVCATCSDDQGNKVLAPCDTMKTIIQG